MDNFLFAINAILPIILLVLLGYFLKKIKFLSDEFLKIGNKFCFYVALPVLLFKNLYDSDISDINWKLIIFCLISVLCIFTIGLFLVIFFTKDNSKRGVLLQAIFRSNFAFIGIPLATILFTNEAMSIEAKMSAALIGAFTIPVFNILAVISLNLFVDKNNSPLDSENSSEQEINSIDTNKKVTNNHTIKHTLYKIVTNPLIIGVAIGFIFIGIRELIPIKNGELLFSMENNIPFLYKTITNVSNIASPLALIVLGGQFRFSAIKGLGKYITFGVLIRIVLVPATVLTIAAILNIFSKPEMGALIALFATPVAVSSATMAIEMNGDGELAGQLVVWTTLFSSITLFIFIFVFKTLGYL